MNLTLLILSLFLSGGRELPQLAETYGAAEPAPKLALSVDLPEKVKAATLARDGLSFAVKLTNESKEELRLVPWVALDVLDAQGKPVKKSRAIGRWGRRGRGCCLAKLGFATLASGQSRSDQVELESYGLDPDMLLGWKLGPGSYELRFRYRADRAQLRKLCSCKEIDHADAKKAWNLVTEIDLTLKRKLVVE